MGLQSELGFRWSPPNPVQRSMQRIAATRSGGWVFQRTLYRVDRPLHRWSDGRLTVPGVLTGLPVIMLTTTGAKTGLARTMPVAGIPLDDDLAILGTNFAQARTPGWVANLLADPRASVAWHARAVPVDAHLVPSGDMGEVWRAAAAVYSGFPDYRERIGQSREVRAFILRPAVAGA